MIDISDSAQLKRALSLASVIGDYGARNKLHRLYWDAMSSEDFALALGGKVECVGHPYPWAVEFHNAGFDCSQRSLLAGNQVGKSETCAAEIAIHATGLYPPWWSGRRFNRPVIICVGSETNELCRDIQQKKLFGGFKPESNDPDGTGWVPADCIGQVNRRVCGIPGVLESVQVRHKSGGYSSIVQKTYEQGWAKWQGVEYDVVWLDEEPVDDRIYPEVLVRTMKRKGLILFSRTPLMGMSLVVSIFMKGGPGIFLKNVTWDDAPHLDKESRERLLLSIPEHERDTRSKGIPMMGSGAVYPVRDQDIVCDPIAIPKHWARVVGIDFGISHPTAVVWVAHNRDTDVLYVYDCYQRKGEAVAYHAAAIKQRGDWIPVSWPHDGLQRDKGSASPLMQQYQAHGVNMIFQSARWEDKSGGGQSKEAAIQHILERMHTGRLKVFSNLNDWFEQKRMYHRKDGIVAPVNDDLMKATDYAAMMLRYAIPEKRMSMPAVAGDYNPLEY